MIRQRELPTLEQPRRARPWDATLVLEWHRQLCPTGKGHSAVMLSAHWIRCGYRVDAVVSRLGELLYVHARRHWFEACDGRIAPLANHDRGFLRSELVISTSMPGGIRRRRLPLRVAAEALERLLGLPGGAP